MRWEEREREGEREGHTAGRKRVMFESVGAGDTCLRCRPWKAVIVLSR